MSVCVPDAPPAGEAGLDESTEDPPARAGGGGQLARAPQLPEDLDLAECHRLESRGHAVEVLDDRPPPRRPNHGRELSRLAAGMRWRAWLTSCDSRSGVDASA